jgi:hypothetical protein
MNRETTKIPILVNPEYIKKSIIKKESFEKIIRKYVSLDFVILLFFIIFLIFFLINCKNGIFKNIDLDPIPYTFSNL